MLRIWRENCHGDTLSKVNKHLIISDVSWDHGGCFRLFNCRHPAWPRWPCHSWSSPGLSPITSPTLSWSTPFILNHLGDLCAASEADGSAPVCPCHSSYWELYSNIRRPLSINIIRNVTVSPNCAISKLIRDPLRLFKCQGKWDTLSDI